MSIHIDSEDYTTGSRYNGVWTFSRDLYGVYTVISQSFEVQDIPWVWEAVDQMRFTIEGVPISFALFVPADINVILAYTTKAEVASYMQTRINYVAANENPTAPEWSVTVTYNATTDNFQLTFICADTVDVAVDWEHSTCRGIFGAQNVNATFGYIHTFTAGFVRLDPKYVYLSIAEARSRFLTTQNFSPNLILSTYDTELTGQKVQFEASSVSLTMKTYLVNICYEPVPLTAGWELVLIPST